MKTPKIQNRYTKKPHRYPQVTAVNIEKNSGYHEVNILLLIMNLMYCFIFLHKSKHRLVD